MSIRRPAIRLVAVGFAAFAALAAALPAVPASAAGDGSRDASSDANDDLATTAVRHDAVVDDNPSGNTPHVLDGVVNAIVKSGDTIVLGGEFTQVASPDSNTIYRRSNLVAFDASTGKVSTTFKPTTDAEVTSLRVSPSGGAVFVGGHFDTVNGRAGQSLAKLKLSDGTRASGFRVPDLNGSVKDIQLARGRLWIGGTFEYVDDHHQPALATLDPTTGAFDPYQRVRFSRPLNGGYLQVLKFDVTPNDRKLVAIGNFSRVEGQRRGQLAMLNLGSERAKLGDWSAGFYNGKCSDSYDSYMQDIDIDPSGTYFVVTTTGAWYGEHGPCDTTSRFEIRPRGSVVKPTWVDYSGGDSMYAVEVTGAAVYIGGHFRWQNNPNTLDGDSAGPGAVSREGIAALDPKNGVPYRWNPGRTKGVGVFDMLATASGLFVASDTDRIGDWEYHGRIAYFPLAGGTGVPTATSERLPADIYFVPPGADRPSSRYFDGRQVGTAQRVPAGNVNWSTVREGFMPNGRLYLGAADGSFTARTFDGQNYGDPVPIDAADQEVVDIGWHRELATATGMFYSRGRIYYTVAGDDALYYRYFSVESGVVGAKRLVASYNVGVIDFSEVRGMFLDGDRMYWAHAGSGNLHRVAFRGGHPIAGTDVVVSGPSIDGKAWRSAATFGLRGTKLALDRDTMPTVESPEVGG